MTIPRTIELLAVSFARVSAHKDEAARLFQARLLTVAPELRAKHQGDLETQRARMLGALAQVVDFERGGIDEGGYLARLTQLSRSYAAQRAQLDAIGDALVFTIAQVLGDDFTSDIRAAWVSTYADVAAALLRSMESEPPVLSLAEAQA